MKEHILTSPGGETVLASLRKAGTVALTTHEGPDGDGIGSEIALTRALRSLGKQVHVINPARSARRFQFLDDGADIRAFKPDLAQTLNEVDLVVLVDTCELRRTGPLAQTLEGRSGPTVAIDHHPPNDHSIDGILGSDYSSTGELMVHILDALGVELTAELAFPLYSAILFDTNQFQFVRNDPEVFAVSARLVASGADAEKAAHCLFGSVSRDRMVLQGRVLGSAGFELDGRLAWARVTPQEMSDLDVDSDDVRSMVMLLGATDGVDIAVLFKVFREGKVKVSMRSPGNIAINDVAATLGGGGHPFAAGADVMGNLDEVMERTLTMLRAKLTSD